MADRYIAYYEAPFGLLLLESTEDVLLRCKWVEDKTKPETETRPILEETKSQLAEYFDGKRQTFNLSINALGTAFQKRCGRSSEPSRTVKFKRIRILPTPSAIRRRRGRSGVPTTKTRCRSSFPATG